MAAKKGNKYAEKWTKVQVIKALTQIHNYVIAEKVFYLAVALTENKLYTDIWNDWTIKFKEDREVSLAIKMIEAKIEANLLSQAAHNKINATIAIFVLKNKYKWSDKQEIDHTSKGESITWNEVKTYGKDSD